MRRLAVTAASALGLSLLAAAPAHAADWTTVMSVHKSKTQLCKEPVAAGWRVKIRIDNRNSDHGHNAGISVEGGGEVNLKVGAGAISKVKSLVVPRGAELSAGMGEPTGEGMGGPQELGRVGAC